MVWCGKALFELMPLDGVEYTSGVIKYKKRFYKLVEYNEEMKNTAKHIGIEILRGQEDKDSCNCNWGVDVNTYDNNDIEYMYYRFMKRKEENMEQQQLEQKQQQVYNIFF